MVTRRQLRSYYRGGGFARRIRLLPEHGVVYVSNPKAACSTVTLWLHRILRGDPDFTPAGNVHAEPGLPRPLDVGWDKAEAMLSGGAFRFTVVRDPIRRAESAYLDKIVHARPHRGDQRQQVQAALGQPVDRDRVPNLDEFVDALEATDPLDMDPHWRPQHLSLMHPLVSYDLIGRVETLDADLERVRETTGLPVMPTATRNVKAGDGSVFDGRPDLLRRISDVYARDFELYGY